MIGTVLVVTNGTEVGAQATARVFELKELCPDLYVHIVVLSAKKVSSIYGSEVDGTERANQQLDSAIDKFLAAGIDAHGEISFEAPMDATSGVLQRIRADLILLSSLPSGLSSFLGLDVPHRMERRFGIPVELVSGPVVNDNDWEAKYEPVEGPLRILLVEDSPEDAHLVRHALADTDERIDLTVVNNGAEALGFLRTAGQAGIDLLLLDLKMPLVTGHELLEILASEFDIDAVRTTVISSSTSPRDRELAAALGARKYIVKDPDIDVFAESIQSLVRSTVYS